MIATLEQVRNGICTIWEPILQYLILTLKNLYIPAIIPRTTLNIAEFKFRVKLLYTVMK